jgi:2,5-dichloro-2,5-cyclohexadiene-1,4-diol dehydrogenase 1
MGNTLENKVGLVTGAGAGIGRAIAQLFAASGCKVVISDIDATGLAETLRLIQTNNGEASSFIANVGKENDISSLVKFTVDTFGGLDVAVNNAGINTVFKPIHELSFDAWQKNIEINLTGVFLCLKHELGYMREHGGGAIVNISSVAATNSVAAAAEYSAAKRGVLSLTSCAAVEGGPKSIRVNAIMPGAIKTKMLLEGSIGKNPDVVDAFLSNTPLGKFGEPNNIAEAALWLVSDAAEYITGQYLGVDGGITA